MWYEMQLWGALLDAGYFVAEFFFIVADVSVTCVWILQ